MAYNASFDMKMIQAEMARIRSPCVKPPKLECIDVLKVARSRIRILNKYRQCDVYEHLFHVRVNYIRLYITFICTTKLKLKSATIRSNLETSTTRSETSGRSFGSASTRSLQIRSRCSRHRYIFRFRQLCSDQSSMRSSPRWQGQSRSLHRCIPNRTLRPPPGGARRAGRCTRSFSSTLAYNYRSGWLVRLS